jgi:hypothetical protein
MRQVTRRSALLIGAFVALCGAASQLRAAAAQEEVRIYGPIQSVNGTTVTARNADGSTVTFRATGRIVSNQPIALDFLKPGLSVALDTAMRNGRTVVTHVHTQGWHRAPGTFATRPLNSDASVTRHLGRIASVEPIAGGGVRMKVAHEGGQSDVTVDVPRDLPILYHNVEQTAAALKPGMVVMANATRGNDGQLGSGFVTVEVGNDKPIRIPD